MIYRAYKLCDVQCLKINQFLQYTLWLKVNNISFCCHLRPDILYMSVSHEVSMKYYFTLGITAECM